MAVSLVDQLMQQFPEQLSTLVTLVLTPAQPPEEERLRWTVLCSILLVSDNGDTPPIYEHTLQIHIQDIGYAFSRVKMMGELGKGGVALRDICMVVQLQLYIG